MRASQHAAMGRDNTEGLLNAYRVPKRSCARCSPFLKAGPTYDTSLDNIYDRPVPKVTA